MNWDAIGAAGEVGGAIGVIITLVYLAVQIRQNTRAMRASSAREILFRFSDWHRDNVKDAEWRRVYDRSLEDPMAEFTPAEWNQMNSLGKTLFHILEAQYVQSRFDVGTGDEIEAHLRGARTLLDTLPAWRKFWEEEAATGHWTEGFAEYIEKLKPGSFPFVKSDRSDET